MRKGVLSRAVMFWILVIIVIGLLITSVQVGAKIVRQYVGKLQNREDIVALLNDGDYIRVLTLSEDSLAFNPVDAQARAFAGIASFYLGLYSYEPDTRRVYLRNAMYHLRLALALSDDFPFLDQVHYILAQTYLQFDEHYANVAIWHLQQAKLLGYQSPKLEEYLGIAYLRMGDYERSVEHLLSSFNNEKNSQYHLVLGEAYAMMGKYNDAQNEFEKAMTMAVDDNVKDRVEMKLAKVYYDMGRLSESKELYTLLLKRFPDNAEAYFIIGKIYEEEGNLTQARANWMQALRLNPQNSEAYAKVYGQ